MTAYRSALRSLTLRSARPEMSRPRGSENQPAGSRRLPPALPPRRGGHGRALALEQQRWMPEKKSTTAGPALTGGPVVGEGAHRADAIGVELAAEWLMLRADRGRLRSTRIKGLV
jgi:hypothetical protein